MIGGSQKEFVIPINQSIVQAHMPIPVINLSILYMEERAHFVEVSTLLELSLQKIKRQCRRKPKRSPNLLTQPMLILWLSKVLMNTRSMGHMV